MIRYSPEVLIKNTAYEIGFSVVGIADVTPSAESDRVFDRWIAAGKHGEMRYLSGGSDKRHDPSLMLEGARSVVSVAVNYYSRELGDTTPPATVVDNGIVSIYAQGRDYHLVLHEMLGELVRRLGDFFPGLESKICVDTQPISERDFAIRAGVAWLGKNACVISKEYGSWIFLGELITNLELKSDQPLRTLCGTCTKCMDACPTGALDNPFVVDATKCISYWTIEKRGDIPTQYHEAIGNHLFGCDICQQVCPFNKFVRETGVFDYRNPNPIVGKTAHELAGISDAEFKELTRESAIGRCKPAGMRRNARIVAKNLSGH